MGLFDIADDIARWVEDAQEGVASLTEPNFYSHPAFRLIIVVFADDVANGFAASATDQYVRFKEEYGTYIKIATLDIDRCRRHSVFQNSNSPHWFLFS